MNQELHNLVQKWRDKTDELEKDLNRSKWYSDMTEAERADFNYKRDSAVMLRKCANELQRLLLEEQ